MTDRAALLNTPAVTDEITSLLATDWMRSAWYVTFMQCPGISVPGGFSANGLPVGVQIVGKPRGDLALLQLAHAFEQATQHSTRRPAL